MFRCVLWCSVQHARRGRGVRCSCHSGLTLQAQQEGGGGGVCSQRAAQPQGLQLPQLYYYTHPQAQHQAGAGEGRGAALSLTPIPVVGGPFPCSAWAPSFCLREWRLGATREAGGPWRTLCLGPQQPPAQQPLWTSRRPQMWRRRT